MTKIGMLHTGIRGDEKLLITAAKNLNVTLEPIDIRKVTLNPEDMSYWQQYDVILERSISTVKGNALIEFLSSQNIPILNSTKVMTICNDKFLTTSVLVKNNVPVLKSILVFDEQSAHDAIINVLGGYPAVIKSREGSWGRLMGKINDKDALEAIFDHRHYMSPDHKAIVIQEYVKKPQGRDIRAFVINDICIAAIYRTSPHWITNTARGGKATKCEITGELQTLCHNASKAVGGGILAMDVFETNEGLKINEINHTMEFKNSEEPTGASISEAIINYCINYAK